MIAIKAGNLFDGTGKEVIEDATVLIEKDRIKEVKGPGQISI